MNNEITLEKEENIEQTEVKQVEPKDSTKLIYGTHINEDDSKVEIITEVAGYNKDNLEITIEAHELRISSKQPEAGGEQRKVIQKEFSDEGYRQAFRLSEKIDAEQITAEVKNGVLRLILPKTPPAQKRQIEVRAV